MAGMEYGLGRFSDRRLEKGGPACIRRWLPGLARAFAALAVGGLARCSSRDFCATAR
jgi:hypothetical protein